MANKLNNLLEGIEGKGGFKDASVASQENAVKELEDGIWALSSRCRTWKVRPLFYTLGLISHVLVNLRACVFLSFASYFPSTLFSFH